MIKEATRKPPKGAESDPKVEKPERKILQNGRRNGSQITKYQRYRGSTRINISEQNIKPMDDNLREPNNNRNEPTQDLKENVSQNRNIAKKNQDVKDKVLTARQDLDQIITPNVVTKIIKKS